MNREILKSMDTGHIPVQRLTALLETFTLKHAARMLPDLLETAETLSLRGLRASARPWLPVALVCRLSTAAILYVLRR